MSNVTLLKTSDMSSRSNISNNGTTIVGGTTAPTDTLLGYSENGTSIVTGASNDKNMFLKLLVAQMSNMDPFSQDQDPTKYITQLAQFSTLEQMQTITSSLDSLTTLTNGLLINSAISTASDLLGKNAEFLESSSSTETIKGQVESVYIEDGIVYMEARLENGELKPFKYESFIKVNA